MRSLVFVWLILFCCTTVACKTSKYVESDLRLDQIELNLTDKMNPQRIEMGFKTLGINHVCTLDKVENICVFSFDTEIKTLEEILTFMGNEVGVESASITKGCNQ